jgi:pantetheine-phosphate adenylyltransferase
MQVVYPGSFDPPTFGHFSIIEKAAELFEKVTIVVAENSEKTQFINNEDKKKLLESLCEKFNNVEVKIWKGLLIDCVRELKADVIIKGLRNQSDLQHEQLMAEANRKLSGIETLFMPCEGKYQYISSSLVRQIHKMAGPVEQFVPAKVNEFLMSKK